MARVVIIGGGISGLSTAYYLNKAGIRPLIVEREGRLGGVIRTDIIDGCTVEAGPDSFLSAKPAARRLCEELGLGGELIGSNDHKRVTYIWRDGRLVRMPDGMTMMIPAKLGPMLTTNLLSWPGKIRAAFDLFRLPTRVERDCSISEFVTQHYGREVLEYIAEPLLAGVYGGDPARLSILSVAPKFARWEAKYGSLTRAARAEVKDAKTPLFTTLQRGLQSLVDAIVDRIEPEVINGAVEKIEQGWRVRVSGEWIDASHVVVACRAAAVLPNLFPDITYTSARVITAGYRKAGLNVSFDGFGFLVPRLERRGISATTWVGNKFEHRTPDDMVLLRCFTTGGKADVRAELKEKLGITAEPRFFHEFLWEHSMPQYEVGHTVKVGIIDAMLRDLPGLHVVGNAYRGIGIPDCISMGREVAERIASAATA
jgi:oxygen-dependent protoporphyrinogen oxidase